jgi:hypothetical protein
MTPFWDVAPCSPLHINRKLWLKIQLCIRELSGSNLGPETGNPDLGS